MLDQINLWLAGGGLALQALRHLVQHRGKRGLDYRAPGIEAELARHLDREPVFIALLDAHWCAFEPGLKPPALDDDCRRPASLGGRWRRRWRDDGRGRARRPRRAAAALHGQQRKQPPWRQLPQNTGKNNSSLAAHCGMLRPTPGRICHQT